MSSILGACKCARMLACIRKQFQLLNGFEGVKHVIMTDNSHVIEFSQVKQSQA